LVAHGDTLGVLHFAAADGGTTATRATEQEDTPNDRLIGVFSEHTALALANLRLRESLKKQSVRDPMTGLYNRRYLEETLERELCRARRSGTLVGVAMLDIDHFKELNDTFGHAAGDSVLCAVAAYLKQQVRGSDIVCRYGGEEFTIVFPDAVASTLAQRCEDLRAGVGSVDVQYGGRTLRRVTVSMGLTTGSGASLDATQLLKVADAALYKTKSLGRNRLHAEALPLVAQ
jgi:diguanylate cyclase (GGDEF)-like protein